MSKREKTIRTILTNALFFGGMVVCAGAVGRLDFLAECRVTCGVDELWKSVVFGAVGLLMMGAAMVVGRNLEFDEEGEENG